MGFNIRKWDGGWVH